MINANIDNSSTNAVKAKVELYNGSTLVKTCTCSDALQKYAVSRVGESNKFFGFGVCQKLDVVLIDLEREINLIKGDTVKVAAGDGENFVYPYPTFFIEDVKRDERTNSIYITAYDALYKASAHTVEEIGLTEPYTLYDVGVRCASFLGISPISVIGMGSDTTWFDLTYTAEKPANIDGTEKLRKFMDAIAEVTQTIYYIGRGDVLIFKRLDVSGDPVLTITKDDYFSLTTGAHITLEAICHATELGDNITAGAEDGTTQYVRDNPFWELREDIVALLNAAFAAIGGISANAFTCSDWTGNYLLEIGDKIALVTEDGNTVFSYVLDDTLTFDGTLSEATQWVYEQDAAETPSNPTSLGEKLNQTYAKVDKANQQIEQVASKTEGNTANIAALTVNTNSISASVSSVEKNTEDKFAAVNDSIETLAKQVSVKMSAEDVTIAIETELSDGVEKVKTSTGFTFDDEGLTISKSDSEITTQITEDGMAISKSGEEVLIANNQGVKAEDLHATTYLIIGNNSRLEDWNGRTACFWIGG